MIGYISKIADMFLFPITVFPPLIQILILSFVFSIITSFYKKKVFSNRNVIEVKEKINAITKKINILRNKNEKEFNRVMEELTNANIKLIKENIKVAIFSLLIGILFFSWVSFNYSSYYVYLPFSFPNKVSLIYVYAILCLVLTLIIDKMLGVGLKWR
jgi:uncharacterized membrane protein (DUF106 family)